LQKVLGVRERENIMENIEKVAREFSRILREWLTPEEMNVVLAENEHETNSGICHTHDYCDANEAMLEAIKKITGRNADQVLDDLANDNIWSDAWVLAEKNSFWAA
jgi:hypothetical protein